MTPAVHKITPVAWSQVSEETHKVVFGEKRLASMDRVDYALVSVDKVSNVPLGYATVRELDSESVYWQYGGGFPTTRSSTRALKVYLGFIEWTMAHGYARITTLVENTNVRYLKMAMHCGFRVIGVRMFKGLILCELLLDLRREG